jgi:hypothetical protein
MERDLQSKSIDLENRGSKLEVRLSRIVAMQHRVPAKEQIVVFCLTDQRLGSLHMGVYL